MRLSLGQLAALLISTLWVLAPPTAHAVCSFGASNEASLQSVFDDILPAGTVDSVLGCLDDSADTLWRQTGGNPTTTIVVEIAGFANSNTLGIYDGTDASNMLTVFSGGMGSGDSAEITITPDGNGRYNVSVAAGGTSTSSFGTDRFGFYLSTPQANIFFSDSALNGDGSDHMYAYRGPAIGVPFAQDSPLEGSIFDAMFYLLAFEDLDARAVNYDGDFQDLLIGARFVAPIPIPAPVLLLALPCLMLLRLARRSRTSSLKARSTAHLRMPAHAIGV